MGTLIECPFLDSEADYMHSVAGTSRILLLYIKYIKYIMSVEVYGVYKVYKVYKQLWSI